MTGRDENVSRKPVTRKGRFPAFFDSILAVQEGCVVNTTEIKSFRQYQDRQNTARISATVEQARVNPALWDILERSCHDTTLPDDTVIVALREEMQKAIYAIHPGQ